MKKLMQNLRCLVHSQMCIAIAGCLSLSCTLLELKTSVGDATGTKVSFSCKWPDTDARNGCDSVYVLMNRATDGIRYLYAESAGAEFQDTVAVFGHYVALAYSYDTKDYEVPQRQGFLTGPEVYIRDFTAQAATLPAGDVEAIRGGSSLDFNAAYRFISLPSQIYSASGLETVSDTEANRFSFKLSPLLADLTVEFTVRAGTSVTINSVAAELSGVPASINLRDGSTSADDIARLITSAQRQDSGSCSAGFLITGIYPPESDALTTGPGILRLCINATCSGVSKTLHPAVNLRKEIVDAKIMTSFDENGRYVTRSRKVKIRIAEELVITSANFSPGGEGDGVERWFDSDFVDVEL